MNKAMIWLYGSGGQSENLTPLGLGLNINPKVGGKIMENQNRGSTTFLLGVVIGSLAGAALALVMAPQSGQATRAQIRDKSLELKGRAEEGLAATGQWAQTQVSGLQEQGRQA
jgi:gas vesicle protein